MRKMLLILGAVALCMPVFGQDVWMADIRGEAGPLAQITPPNAGAKRRAVFVVFEYARQCDPLFSLIEINGSKLGRPIKKSALSGSKIGVVVNGKFHTWHAVQAQYDNGFEVGFGVTNELFDLLMGKLDSLAYITPEGETISLPTAGFRSSLASALEVCAKRYR